MKTMDNPRCASCYKLIVAEEFYGRDSQGRIICTECEENSKRRKSDLVAKMLFALSVIGLVAIVAKCTIIGV